ncbi:DUF3093 domain-containing protein [Sanguibacter sp. 25GB23B1]|uniref:DUF3093 domain-containing protein n=1 Tax=unclassified Sanguibacter TaxID=2645534 RepID=UPI0032AF9036
MTDDLSPPAPASGPHDDRGARTAFRERLVPGIGGWVGVLAFAGVFGVALSVVTPTVGVLVGAALLVLGAVLAWVTSPVVEIVGGELHAGAAHIPLRFLGEVRVLDRDGVREQMGPTWDPQAFACLRTWTGGAVRVEVVDPADGTPYWIVSSRRAVDLAAALSARD